MSSTSALLVVLRTLLVFGTPEGPVAPRPPGAAHAPAADLAATVRAAAGDKAFGGLELSLAVGCASGEGAPALWQADTLRNPASGAKLLTTAAALAHFGPAHRFTATLEGPAAVDGVVTGSLTLRPSGAPDLQASALREAAEAVAQAGVRQVTGDVVIDLGRFAPGDMPPAFGQKQTDAAYRPRVPPLGVGDGAVLVTVRPGRKAGAPVRVTTDLPEAAVPLAVTAKTVAGKGTSGLSVRGGGERVEVSGELGAKAAAASVRLRHPDPAEGARVLLRAALKEAGVRVKGKVRFGRAEGSAPAAGHTYWTHEGMSLADLIAVINIKSNNYWAEALLRLLADPARGPLSFALGAEAVAAMLAGQLALPPQSFKIVNGSGLYDATRVTARGMLALLVAHGGDERSSGSAPGSSGRSSGSAPGSSGGAGAAQAFQASLARAGETGTLERRLTALKGRVRAKTGTLSEAVSLSGYITRQAGCTLAFTALVEGPLKDRAATVVGAIDRWVEALAGP